MQIEDLDHLGRQVKEMKNRLTMEVVDDPHSHLKIPDIEDKSLDHVGITGIMTDSNKATTDQRQRTSKALSIGSQQFQNILTISASKRTVEGRHMGTLKLASMPVLTKPKVKGMKKENPGRGRGRCDTR